MKVELIRLDENAAGEWIPVEVAVDGRLSGEFSILRPVYHSLRQNESALLSYLGRMGEANLRVPALLAGA